MLSVLELKVPPVAIVFVVAAAMWAASAWTPSLAIELPWRRALGPIVAGAGIAFAVAGVLAFRRAGTTVDPTRPEAASAIVASGVYRLSRNPMYVGFAFVLAGWALHLDNPLAFALLPAFVLYMNRFQILPEERALARRFGDAYGAYRYAVRRWL